MNNHQETIHRLQTYGKGICWHSVVTLNAAEQQRLHELLTDAAAALSSPRGDRKYYPNPEAEDELRARANHGQPIIAASESIPDQIMREQRENAGREDKS